MNIRGESFTDADLIAAGQDWGDVKPDTIQRIARLVEMYHADATTLSAAETLAEIARVLGPPRR